jgi:hypothetical protein
LQGVNLGPLHTQPNLPDLTLQYRDLWIDSIRTHDFFGPTDIDSDPKDRGAALVIFPDWNADPGREESYQFGPSDRLIEGIVACALTYLQDAPLDRSYYYTGNAGNMGSFEPDGSYRKKADALKATGAMLDAPRRLAVSGSDTMGFAVLAGRSVDQRTVQVLVSNYQVPQPQGPPRQSAPPGSRGLERRQIRSETIPAYALRVAHLPWGKRPFTVKRYRTDEQHDFALMEEFETRGGALELERPLAPPAIELIVLRRN